MKLTDEFLSILNQMVAPTLPKDDRLAEVNLKRLTAELHASHIAGEDLDSGVDVREGNPSLAGHVLLHSNEILALDWNDVWIRLQGGGPKNTWANTVFGNLNDPVASERCIRVIGDKKLSDELHLSETAPVSVGERVVLCLRILGSLGVYASKPDVYQAVQQCLSETLLNYPVLMHPKILVPIYRKGIIEYANVLHAVAASTGGLPRRSHFESGYAGPDLAVRLEAFSKHPCVTLALRQQSSFHVGPSSKDSSVIARKPQRLIPFAFKLANPRVQFLASVLEIEEFTQPGANLPMSSWHPHTRDANKAEADKEERTLLIKTMAASFFAASGLIHSSSARVVEVVECLGSVEAARQYTMDADFLSDIRRCSRSLSEDQDFINRIRDRISNRIFVGRLDNLGVADIRANTVAMISGLTASGITQSPSEAATFIVDAVLGEGRVHRNVSFPKAEIESAFAFIETIYEAGGFGKPESGEFERTVKIVNDFPNYVPLYRNQWSQAISAFGTEQVMRAVISRARNESSAQAEVASEIGGGNAPIASNEIAGSRRRRVAL